MKQQTLAVAADQSFENCRKPTRRDEFLKAMEAIVSWASLCAVIEPHYPKAGNGRPPIGLERMRRKARRQATTWPQSDPDTSFFCRARDRHPLRAWQ